MPKTVNTIKTEGEITTIFITKTDDPCYLKEVLLDTENLNLIDKVSVRKNKTSLGYAWITNRKQSLAHLILNHPSNKDIVVDHINGNSLDNRKCNLRLLSSADNANNRTRNLRCNTNTVGISKRVSGKYVYFRVIVTERGLIINNSRQAVRHYKQFNITALGEEQAFELAKDWLDSKRKEFNYI